MTSYYRKCRRCGDRIQLRKMPDGQWVAFEGYDQIHHCGGEKLEPAFTVLNARPEETAHSDEEILRVIERGIREKRVVQISYVSQYRGFPHRTTREIEPLLLREGLIDAYCRLRRDGRTFRLDRIQAAELGNERFTPKPQAKSERQHSPSQKSASSQRSQTPGCAIAVLLGGGIAFSLVYSAIIVLST